MPTSSTSNINNNGIIQDVQQQQPLFQDVQQPLFDDWNLIDDDFDFDLDDYDFKNVDVHEMAWWISMNIASADQQNLQNDHLNPPNNDLAILAID